MENADNILFRCHQLGALRTGGRSKGELFGATAKKAAVKAYILHRYGRSRKIENKYCEKGTAVEDDGITLLAKHTRTMYRKNTERLSNDFITGEWDLESEEEIGKVITDIKSSWDMDTFLESKLNPLSSDYIAQMHGYLDLTGAKRAKVAFCLCNATSTLIDDEKRRLAYSLNCFGADTDPPEYIEGCKMIERNMIFDMKLFLKHTPWYALHETDWKWDIPEAERIHIFTVERDENEISETHAAVLRARQFLNETFYTPKS